MNMKQPVTPSTKQTLESTGISANSFAFHISLKHFMNMIFAETSDPQDQQRSTIGNLIPFLRVTAFGEISAKRLFGSLEIRAISPLVARLS